jgi:uncharacterized protein YjbI with pentapeptide repeats
MSTASRYSLAYLWILTATAITIALVFFAPTVVIEKTPPFSSLACAPYRPDKCATNAPKKKISQAELDAIVSRHQQWLNLDAAGKKQNSDLWADLRNCDLEGLRLTNVKLNYADLTDAALGPDSNGHATDLTNSDLGDATMICTDLRRAELRDVGLKDAHLEWTKLCGADLHETHLENASLLGSNLTDAAFEMAKMEGAHLPYADLMRTHFEIDPSSLPDAASLAFATNLSALSFDASPASLAKLRDQLKGMGLHEEEKELTAAIMRAEMLRRDPSNPTRLVHGNAERIFNSAFFDWTCAYGYKPGRPLELLGVFFFLFAIVYVAAQQIPGSRGGIWAVWDEHRILRDDGLAGTERLSDGFPRSALSDTRVGGMFRNLGLSVVGLALWFSLLSAFHIGWQAFNFGTWFSRMQPREYHLYATGWVRFASGLQSLISVYFVALWLLTYFGTPFE